MELQSDDVSKRCVQTFSGNLIIPGHKFQSRPQLAQQKPVEQAQGVVIEKDNLAANHKIAMVRIQEKDM